MCRPRVEEGFEEFLRVEDFFFIFLFEAEVGGGVHGLEEGGDGFQGSVEGCGGGCGGAEGLG